MCGSREFCNISVSYEKPLCRVALPMQSFLFLWNFALAHLQALFWVWVQFAAGRVPSALLSFLLALVVFLSLSSFSLPFSGQHLCDFQLSLTLSADGNSVTFAHIVSEHGQSTLHVAATSLSASVGALTLSAPTRALLPSMLEIMENCL